MYGTIVPAYFYPSGTGLTAFNDLIAIGTTFPVVAIVNPASGPGTLRDANYGDVISRGVAAGLEMIGYVSTNYGDRSSALVYADIDKWVTLYGADGISGIFLDEQEDGAEDIALYENYVAYIRAAIPGAFVVTNPGGSCVEGYLSTAAPDAIVTAESAGAIANPPAWHTGYAAENFAAMAHNCSSGTMSTLVAAIPGQGYGWVYVTNDVLVNPWDTLPSYWTTEKAAIQALNAGGDIAGIASGVGAATATLVGRGRLVGASAGTAALGATLRTDSDLVGTAAGAATVTGTLRGGLGQSASAAGLATASATLRGASALVGTTTGVGAASSTLRGRTALAGFTGGFATTSAVVDGIPVAGSAIAGITAGTSTVDATIRAATALAAAVEGLADVVGTLSIGNPSTTTVPCLVFDMRNPPGAKSSRADAIGQWYAWRVRGEPFGACVHGGVQYHISRDGAVRYEVTERRYDDTDFPILTKVHLAPMSLADIQGAERIYRGLVDGEGTGAAEMRLTIETVDERGTTSAVRARDFSMDATRGEFEFIPALGRCTSIEITLEEVASAHLTGGHQVKGLGLEVGISGQLGRLTTSRRI